MSKFFLNATYNEEVRKSAVEQTYHIRDAFVERIGRLDWLQDETKTQVQEKVKNMILEVGYLDKVCIYNPFSSSPFPSNPKAVLRLQLLTWFVSLLRGSRTPTS